jgi:hypothetical protein
MLEWLARILHTAGVVAASMDLAERWTSIATPESSRAMSRPLSLQPTTTTTCTIRRRSPEIETIVSLPSKHKQGINEWLMPRPWLPPTVPRRGRVPAPGTSGCAVAAGAIPPFLLKNQDQSIHRAGPELIIY